ncbi:MAG: class B sortase [Oribacterium sp.]|nr:class B sortase [Oribacterium sp.]
MASGEMSEGGKKKSSGIGGLLFYMVPVVAVAAMLIFGGLFLRDYMEYKAAGDEYADLAADYIRGGDADEANAVAGNADGAAGESVGAKSLPYPSLQIDYDALLNTNADFACVLYIPVLELRYPVVYSSDNVDYLHKTFEGKQNFAGTIFYDCLSPHDFRAKNTFFFGHNMKNGSMFGTLKKFEKEPGLCASNPYIYVYTKGYVRKYRIFSFYETTDGSATYDDFEGTDGYDQYVKRCLSKSTLAIDEHTIDFAKRPALLTLSTCIGRSGGNQRFVVHAALEGAYNITGECRP